MKIVQANNGLSYLSFPETRLSEVAHGFFTRNGGVSPHPFDSLNLSISTGDTRENVRKNRDLLFPAIDRQPGSMFDVWQVHSATNIFSDKPRGNEEPIKADAIFTNNPGVTLLMRFADCVPILIYDPVRKVVGIIHAGWQGTVKQIAKKAIVQLTEEYGCNPEDIQAVIGPAIGAHHYQIGEEVHHQAIPLFKNVQGVIDKTTDGHVTLNLPLANEVLLKQTGVRSVLQSQICTACDTENWYSHRAEKGQTGRFAAVIGLNE